MHVRTLPRLALSHLRGGQSHEQPTPVLDVEPTPVIDTQLRAQLRRAAYEERARLVRATVPFERELASRPRDLVGGSFDEERGSALLRFPDLDAVIATDDVDELRVLLRAAQNHPVRLNFVRRSGDGPYALAFEFNRWEVVVRADLLLPAATA